MSALFPYWYSSSDRLIIIDSYICNTYLVAWMLLLTFGLYFAKVYMYDMPSELRFRYETILYMIHTLCCFGNSLLFYANYKCALSATLYELTEYDWLTLIPENNYPFCILKTFRAGYLLTLFAITMEFSPFGKEDKCGIFSGNAQVCNAFRFISFFGYLTVVSIFITIIFYLCELYFNDRRRQTGPMGQTGQVGQTNLNEHLLRRAEHITHALSWIAPISVGILDDTICSICLMDITKNDEWRKLKCNHVFHSICVDKWILKKNSCPMCRQNVISPDEYIEI